MGKIINQNYFSNVNLKINQKGGMVNQKSGITFKDLLDKKKEEKLKFSTHAQKRITMRNLKVDENEIANLEKGVGKLRQKGGKDSVVLLNEKAYVISVKNNTVVTIIDSENLNENVFTNIDSMIIL